MLPYGLKWTTPKYTHPNDFGCGTRCKIEVKISLSSVIVVK